MIRVLALATVSFAGLCVAAVSNAAAECSDPLKIETLEQFEYCAQQLPRFDTPAPLGAPPTPPSAPAPSVAAPATQQFVAIVPDDVSVYFGRGTTQAEANSSALAACRRLSSSCATGPANTNNMEAIVAHMCCMAPRFGCAVALADTREQAREEVASVFAKSAEGFSKCSLRGYYSVRTGQKY